MDHDSLLRSLGAALRERRERAGVSQEAFAEAIGMHRTYYSAVERGEKNLQLDTLSRICAGFDSDIWPVVRDAESRKAER